MISMKVQSCADPEAVVSLSAALVGRFHKTAGFIAIGLPECFFVQLKSAGTEAVDQLAEAVSDALGVNGDERIKQVETYTFDRIRVIFQQRAASNRFIAPQHFET